MKSITLYLEDEDYKVLNKYILERKMAGEKLTFNHLLRTQLKDYINSLKNGNRASEIDNKKVDKEEEQEVSENNDKNTKFDFDDVIL